MNIILVPIGGLMLIVLIFILNSIRSKENNSRLFIKILISLIFVAAFVAICYVVPAGSFQ